MGVRIPVEADRTAPVEGAAVKTFAPARATRPERERGRGDEVLDEVFEGMFKASCCGSCTGTMDCTAGGA